MEWNDMEKMTVAKLREEALKHPGLEGVHGMAKEKLMDELAALLGIEKPHVHFSDRVMHTKGDLKHQIKELKVQRDKCLDTHDHQSLKKVRREIHDLKRKIRRIEARAKAKAQAQA